VRTCPKVSGHSGSDLAEATVVLTDSARLEAPCCPALLFVPSPPLAGHASPFSALEKELANLCSQVGPLVSSLSLYDIKGAPGVAADVSHVDTPSEVKDYAADELDQALEDVQIVVIPAGVPRKVSCPFPRTTIPYLR
jgi:hypothetical protein